MLKPYSNDWHNWILDISIFFHVPYLFAFNNFLFIFGCNRSSLLLKLFSSCKKWELFSGCDEWSSRCSGFSGCGAQALVHVGSVVAAYELRSSGSIIVAHRLVAPQHGGSSWVKD